MTEQVLLHVKGEDGKTHALVITKSGSHTSATCTCSETSATTPCAHMRAFAAGDKSILANPSEAADFDKAYHWLCQTTPRTLDGFLQKKERKYLDGLMKPGYELRRGRIVFTTRRRAPWQEGKSPLSLLSKDATCKRVLTAARTLCDGEIITFAILKSAVQSIHQNVPLPRDEHRGNLPFSSEAKRFLQELARQFLQTGKPKPFTIHDILEALRSFEERREDKDA